MSTNKPEETVKKINPFERIAYNIQSDIKITLYSDMQGKILTIIDGAITGERQNKAVKDQIRSIFGLLGYNLLTLVTSDITRVAKEEGVVVSTSFQQITPPIQDESI